MNANVASYLLYEIIQQVSVEIIYQSFCLQLVSAALKWQKIINCKSNSIMADEEHIIKHLVFG